jgi:hypothetical protein
MTVFVVEINLTVKFIAKAGVKKVGTILYRTTHL